MKPSTESTSIHRSRLRSGGIVTALFLLLVSATWSPPQESAPDRSVDGDRLLEDLRILSHDSMEGRRAGTPGAERARRYLLEAFPDRGLAPIRGRETQTFTFHDPLTGDAKEGVNVLGMVPGTERPERFVVVTAHYDHLGVRNGDIYNGADDNASGTAALLALAEVLSEHRPAHSVLFVALDAEEIGLLGARAFVANPPVSLDSVIVNVNLDMVSRSEVDELYAAGTFHYPFLTPLIEEVAARAPIHLPTGHDSPDLPPGDDWTMASDHGAFHEVGIPFVYFGVEDHPGYHHPSDTFENITAEFYVHAVNTVLDFLAVVDREGEALLERRLGLGDAAPAGTFALAEGALP